MGGVIDEHNQLAIYVALTLMLFLGRGFGEVARKLRQPMVMGELLAGVFLGKTLLGRIWPAAWNFMFEKGTVHTVGVFTVSSLAVTLFMLIAGIEMQLKKVVQKARPTAFVSAFTIIVPFFVGFFPAVIWPDALGRVGGLAPVAFATFVGTAMSITALPVVAKTLRDLGLIRTEMGTIVMASATVCDLAGWCLFALSLSMTGSGDKGKVAMNISLSVVFVVGMLTYMRKVFHRALPYAHAYLSWPGGVLGFVGTCMFIASSFATWVNLHSTLGSFVTGAAFGDSPHLRESTRMVMDQFVSFIFVPIFFASIGINVDFIGDFDIKIVAVIFILACIGKLVGGYVGARLSGQPHRESLAIATCMNSRGGIAIILATAALDNGVIDNKMFVALIVMAIGTSFMCGPLLNMVVVRPSRPPFTNFVKSAAFIPRMIAKDREQALRQLCNGLAAQCPNAYELVAANETKLRAAGETMSYEDRVAVPYALVPGLQRPFLGMGLSRDGVEFVPADEAESCQIVVLCLLPSTFSSDEVAAFIADLRNVLADKDTRESFLNCKNKHELRAANQVARLHIQERNQHAEDHGHHDDDDVEAAGSAAPLEANPSSSLSSQAAGGAPPPGAKYTFSDSPANSPRGAR